MSKLFCLTVLLIVSAMTQAEQEAASLYQQLDSQIPWQLVRDENNIQVYIVETDSTDILKAKAVAIIHSPLIRIKQILDDVEHRHEWVPYLLRSRIEATQSATQKTEYALFAAPWPASDRDFIYSVQQQENNQNRLLYVMKSVQVDSVPEKPGIVRAELFESVYSLTAIDRHTTKVEIIFHTDPKGWLPRWIVNIIQKALPYKILINLRDRADSYSV